MAFDDEADGGVETHGFFDTSADIWEVVAGFFVLDLRRKKSRFLRKFGLGTRHRGGVLDEVVEDGAEGNGGRVRAGENVAA